MSQMSPVYKVSGPLILSGALSDVSSSKCLHALFVLAQGRNWKPDSRGMYRVTIGELHRLTGKTCARWSDYLKTFNYIRDTVRLDWGHLSRQVGGFNRVGDTPLLTECYAEMDLGGGFLEISFSLPSSLIHDVIKPHWYGQVDTSVLFSLRGNYAFNAYLFASLTVIEKDSKRSEFYSKAYSINEWREILGSGDSYPYPSHFRAKVFKRTEAQLKDVKGVDGRKLNVSWVQSDSGFWQMKVQRLKRSAKRVGSFKAPERPSKASQDVLDTIDALRGSPAK